MSSRIAKSYSTSSASGNRYSNSRHKIGGGKFCKVCKDQGRSIAEYTSHYVRESRDPNSKVVCPLLIAAVCRYCKDGGHTVKHCPKIEAKNRQQAKAKMNQSHIISKNYCVEITKEKKKKSSRNQNNFAAFNLLDDDDSDEEVENVIATAPVKTPPPSSNIASYANAIKKAPPPTNSYSPSQVASLIPTKIDFEVDAIKLSDVTGKWADEEDDLTDADVLTLNVDPPTNIHTNHPLKQFTDFIDIQVAKFISNNSNTSISISAFQFLRDKWDNEYFNECDDDLKDSMRANIATNKKSRNLIMLSRYTR